MKFKITNKQVKENYSNRIFANEIDNLLIYENPVAYNNGVYGWNYDIYEINPSTCIIKGYRNFPPAKKADYSKQKEYSEKARTILNDYSKPYETQKNRLRELLNNFVAEVLNNEN